MQYANITLNITLRKLDFLVNCTAVTGQNGNPSGYIERLTVIPDTKIYCEYIYLDKDERRQFAQNNHEYLIEQVQYTPPLTLTETHTLNFNNHIKELIWICRDKNIGEKNAADSTSPSTTDVLLNVPGSAYADGNDYFNYTSNATTNTEYLSTIKSYEAFGTAKIVIEGTDRISPQKATYFRTIQPLNHHTKIPEKHIYCYSFALKPEEYQPSGTMNFSKVDDAYLQLTLNKNINFLR